MAETVGTATPKFAPDGVTRIFDVQFLSPSSLLPYYRNSKRHDRRQIVLLAKALKTSGFDQPIVVDKDMVIIKGHGRRLPPWKSRWT